MSSFDFTALIKFLGSLFDALVALFEKLGFSFGGDDTTEDAADAEVAEG